MLGSFVVFVCLFGGLVGVDVLVVVRVVCCWLGGCGLRWVVGYGWVFITMYVFLYIITVVGWCLCCWVVWLSVVVFVFWFWSWFGFGWVCWVGGFWI